MTRDGTGRSNPTRDTKFSGANGDQEICIFLCCSADHEQDFSLNLTPVDPYQILLFICHDHTNSSSCVNCWNLKLFHVYK